MTNARILQQKPQTTGGFIVTFKEGVSKDEKMSVLSQTTDSGVESLSLSDPQEKFMAMAVENDTSVVFDELSMGVTSKGFFEEAETGQSFGVLNTQGRQVAQTFEDHDSIERVRPEYMMHALWNFKDQEQRTWGIDATRVAECPYDGTGIKVAVLDTGFDHMHQDFVGRNVTTTSFVPSETSQDLQGHGTHCAGTAVGNAAIGLQYPARYGAARNADLYAGKVLGNNGSGRESWIIAGMMWAIQSGCHIISMSLGRNVEFGEAPDVEYERIGQFALDNGCLIIAASGNASRRNQGYVAPVGAPANSPSILAVAAVDERLRVASFSSGGTNVEGGEVNIAAPGVQIFSSMPGGRYGDMSGTSMACPNVAGIAALWAQKDNNLRGQALWDALQNSARDLKKPRRDVGAGLVQVPRA